MQESNPGHAHQKLAVPTTRPPTRPTKYFFLLPNTDWTELRFQGTFERSFERSTHRWRIQMKSILARTESNGIERNEEKKVNESWIRWQLQELSLYSNFIE